MSVDVKKTFVCNNVNDRDRVKKNSFATTLCHEYYAQCRAKSCRFGWSTTTTTAQNSWSSSIRDILFFLTHIRTGTVTEESKNLKRDAIDGERQMTLKEISFRW